MVQRGTCSVVSGAILIGWIPTGVFFVIKLINSVFKKQTKKQIVSKEIGLYIVKSKYQIF